MGILNVTPDSFSDGGKYHALDAARARAEAMIAEGVDIIDVGGESTRPGAAAVDAGEELRRVLPVVEAIASLDTVISIDTSKAEVARATLSAGAHIVNNVGALTIEPEVADAAAEHGAGLVLMHMRGEPRTMQANPTYGDVIGDIRSALREATAEARSRGGVGEWLANYTGVGLGKTFDHNWTLIARLDAFADLGLPILVGTSRKRFLREAVGADLLDLEIATAATCVAACMQGARIVRVHDVRSHRLAMAVTGEILGVDRSH